MADQLHWEQAAPVVTPAPAIMPELKTEAVLTLAAIIREVDGNHRMGAAALAEAILRHPAADCVFVASPPQPPMPWPELPEEVPECLLPDDQSSILRPFALFVWQYASITLAEMNPNRRQEGVSRG